MDSFGNSTTSSSYPPSYSGSGGAAGGGGQPSKEEVLRAANSQMQMAVVMQLLQTASASCFKKCVSKPGTSLDSYETSCIQRCADRYLETWKHVSKVSQAMQQRLSQQ
eukprot:m.18566 g.18566  ORF g.18566 m.18566 type:complete len:108 (+) comp5746_c0_seq1:163-486(+)